MRDRAKRSTDAVIAEQYIRHPHRRLACEAFVGAVIDRLGRRFLRKRLPPSLAELSAMAEGGAARGSEELLCTVGCCGSFLSRERLEAVAGEHERLNAELQERYDRLQVPFPVTWAVEHSTGYLLYALVRAFRPRTVLEVGVGNGASSFFILRALEANRDGKLYSLDISPDAGGLLTGRERTRWEFHLVGRRDSARSMAMRLAALPMADFCFHDAGHAYLPQYFELSCLWSRLRSAGYLVMDDVDASYAMIDFCHRERLRPQVLIDRRKAVAVLSRGVARSPQAAGSAA